MAETYAPDNALMSVFELACQSELQIRFAFEQCPHSVARARQKVLVAFRELELNYSQFVESQPATRNSGLGLGQVPYVDVGVLLLL